MNAFHLQRLLDKYDECLGIVLGDPDDMGAGMALNYAEDALSAEVVDIARFALMRDADANRLMEAAIKQNHEIEQTLGEALGFPYYADDQITFPGSTREDGVCVAPDTAETLAMMAAGTIKWANDFMEGDLFAVGHEKTFATIRIYRNGEFLLLRRHPGGHVKAFADALAATQAIETSKAKQ